MSSNLKKLHVLALKLNNIGMRQTAGDLDYLISWLISADENNGVHREPDSAGENTIDAYSNNCPIPYAATRDSVIACTARFYASSLLSDVLEVIDELRATYTQEVETIAFNEYVNNIHKIMNLLDEEEWLDWERLFPDFDFDSFDPIGDGSDINWPLLEV